MRRGFGAALLCLVAATASSSTRPACAEPRLGGADAAPSATPQTDDQRKAQEHFQRAKELYQAGHYSEAIVELEVARGLDPKAKDLVMNLGIVNEKLGRYDEAISCLKAYLEVEGVTAAERVKVEGMLKRIEGAKSSAAARNPETSSAAHGGPVAIAPPRERSADATVAPPRRGRVDALTIGAGTVAAIGLGLGATLGVYALAARPGDDFVTGRDGSYARLRDASESAHTAAVVADVSLGVGVVALLATAWLYASRTKDPATKPAASAIAGVRVAVDPDRSRGIVSIGGAF